MKNTRRPKIRRRLPFEEFYSLWSMNVNGNQYEGILPKSGDYKIRAYLMRSAARRNEVANYQLEVIITVAESNMETTEPAETNEN